MLERDGAAEGGAHVLGERDGIALVRRPLGERAQHVAQVAQRDPLLDEAAQHVGEQHGRDELGHDLAHERRVRALEAVEERLRLLHAEQLVAVAAHEGEHLVAEARARRGEVLARDRAARERHLVEAHDEGAGLEAFGAQAHGGQREAELGEQALTHPRHDLGHEWAPPPFGSGRAQHARRARPRPRRRSA